MKLGFFGGNLAEKMPDPQEAAPRQEAEAMLPGNQSGDASGDKSGREGLLTPVPAEMEPGTLKYSSWVLAHRSDLATQEDKDLWAKFQSGGDPFSDVERARLIQLRKKLMNFGPDDKFNADELREWEEFEAKRKEWDEVKRQQSL